jgi:hypothetical protein
MELARGYDGPQPNLRNHTRLRYPRHLLQALSGRFTQIRGNKDVIDLEVFRLKLKLDTLESL